MSSYLLKIKRPHFQYYVIQFLELPHKDIDEYVCIPWSWIRKKRYTNNKVMVSYPVEDPSDTEKRVKTRQRFSREWKLFKSVVKHRTDVYEEAQSFTQEMIYIGKYSNKTNKDHKLSKNLENKSHRPKVETPPAVSKNEDTSAIKIKLKRKPSRKPSTEVAEQSRQETCTQENSNNIKSIDKTDPPESSTQNRTSVNKDSSDQEYRKRYKQEYFTDYLMLLTKLHVSFADMHSMFDQLREAFNDNSETVVKLIKTLENSLVLSNVAPVASTSNNTTAEVTTVSEGKRSEENEQIDDESDEHNVTNVSEGKQNEENEQIDDESDEHNVTNVSEGKQKEENEQIDDESDESDDDDGGNSYDDDDDEDDSNEETPNKRRYYMRKFILPSGTTNYRWDTEWTLKYRNPARGLIELMPQTKVYIDAESLENCKTQSNNCETLARMLLVEIFSREALSVCSLTGEGRPMIAGVRPALDRRARKVLLAFVQQHGRQKGWPILHTKSLMTILRNKLMEMRAHRHYFS